jgi:aspartyl-tRNA synthetase
LSRGERESTIRYKLVVGRLYIVNRESSMEKLDRTLAKETIKKIGKKIRLNGWVDTVRDHGGVTFIDLRDRSGLVQCVVDKLPKVTNESVVEIIGKVKNRPEKLVNPNLETGKIEIHIERFEILSPAEEIPIPLSSDGLEIEESSRLKYRYLDLRRKRMSSNLRLRSRTVHFIRNWLSERDFVEIETPILTKTTPEGARDFIVPSRLQAGKFYALPQSPQQYKQLLMVAGFERYFQIARCFRDEDPRADRAYGEFTQLDLEMSFVTQDDILSLTEELYTELVKKIFPDKKITKSPWPRISYKTAMEKYGSDKPDLRKNKKGTDELAFAWIIDFPLFVKQTEEDFFHGSGKASFAPSHHMFTAPHTDDIKFLSSDPTKVRGLQHDMVLNGREVGGGSIRIHQAEIQKKVFDLIGFSEKQKRQFEHMLTAFSFGVPPHGGIAPGIDRFLYAVLGEPSLREVIAFPMTSSGITSGMDAPSQATKEQLKELGIKVVRKKSE